MGASLRTLYRPKISAQEIAAYAGATVYRGRQALTVFAERSRLPEYEADFVWKAITNAREAFQESGNVPSVTDIRVLEHLGVLSEKTGKALRVFMHEKGVSPDYELAALHQWAQGSGQQYINRELERATGVWHSHIEEISQVFQAFGWTGIQTQKEIADANWAAMKEEKEAEFRHAAIIFKRTGLNAEKACAVLKQEGCWSYGEKEAGEKFRKQTISEVYGLSEGAYQEALKCTFGNNSLANLRREAAQRLRANGWKKRRIDGVLRSLPPGSP